MKKLKIAAIASALVVSGSAMAASDGTLDTTSTGTSIVTIIKQNAVQITNVNDLNLGTHAVLAADQVAADDVCVFSSTSGYNLTVTSANGAFNLQDSATATPIPYTMSWTTAAGSSAVGYGSAIAGLTGDNVSLDCSAGTNANFEITVSSADFNSADPGTYSDTLTLLVQPE